MTALSSSSPLSKYASCSMDILHRLHNHNQTEHRILCNQKLLHKALDGLLLASSEHNTPDRTYSKVDLDRIQFLRYRNLSSIAASLDFLLRHFSICSVQMETNENNCHTSRPLHFL